jgi:hypothetical protein
MPIAINTCDLVVKGGTHCGLSSEVGSVTKGKPKRAVYIDNVRPDQQPFSKTNSKTSLAAVTHWQTHFCLTQVNKSEPHTKEALNQAGTYNQLQINATGPRSYYGLLPALSV